jgi:Tfp pilus assembly protein PilF
VSLFQAGMEALQRHEYRASRDLFRSLIADFPSERALLDRARVYSDLCERELRRRPAQPQTAEECLTMATAALNNGDEARAESFVAAVLSEHPEQDLALYLSAAIHARRGQHEEALAQLRQAIAVSPDVAAQATLDSDFDALHTSEAFLAMTDSSGGLLSRRPPHRFQH